MQTASSVSYVAFKSSNYLSFQLIAADAPNGLACFQNKNFTCALQDWSSLADRGVPQANFNLGILYAAGNGVPADPSKAFAYFEKAAEAGMVQAQFNVAEFYAQGLGIAKDPDKAISWFQKAAERGDPNAANNLATLIEAKDPQGAMKWYREAADQGLAIAQFQVGRLYDLGIGVPQDFTQAHEWYEKAAAQGDAAALCNLAILYYNGEGVKLDREASYRYFLLASKAGDARAKDLITMASDKIGKKQAAAAEEQAREWESTHHFQMRPSEIPEALAGEDAKIAPTITSPVPATL